MMKTESGPGKTMGKLPSGKRLHNYGKSPRLMGKLIISMAIFNSFLYVSQRLWEFKQQNWGIDWKSKGFQITNKN
jgi:hypothetical protein